MHMYVHTYTHTFLWFILLKFFFFWLGVGEGRERGGDMKHTNLVGFQLDPKYFTILLLLYLYPAELCYVSFQLVYQLFTTNLEPGEEDVNIVMQMAEEAVRAQERDPYTAFANRVRELNYGNSYFFRVSVVFYLESFNLFSPSI